jgi:tRNA splicing endonuclease
MKYGKCRSQYANVELDIHSNILVVLYSVRRNTHFEFYSRGFFLCHSVTCS